MAALATIGTILNYGVPIANMVVDNIPTLVRLVGGVGKKIPVTLIKAEESGHVSSDLVTNLLSLKEKTIDNINDMSKDTVKTIEAVDAVLMELHEKLMMAKGVALHIDQAIPD